MSISSAQDSIVSAVTNGVPLPPSEPLDIMNGYDIPIVDLDTVEGVHVVVDKEKGQYLGHPTTVLLSDKKTILCVYPKGHGRGAIVLKKSIDGGKTWSDRLPTPTTWSSSREVPTMYDVTDANGKKRLIMFSGHQNNDATVNRVRMAVSEDEGTTWGELLSMETLPAGIVAMADVIALNTGKGHYMATYHRRLDGIDARGPFKTLVPLVTFSEDGGMSWSAPIPVGSGIRDKHLCEGGFVRSPDGKTIAMLLRENNRLYNSQVIFSTDEGKTWSPPKTLPAALNGDRHQVVYLTDGRLLVQFRDLTPHKKAGNISSPTEGDWVAWVGQWSDIVDGTQGEYRIRMKDNTEGADTAYPAGELLPDGTLVCTTYGHFDKMESPYIRTVRFKIADTDKLAKQQRSGARPVIKNVNGDKESIFDPNNPGKINQIIQKQ